MAYTDSAAYFAAAGNQTLQDLNNPISNTDTSIKYNNLVVSCSGSDSCIPGFWGTQSVIAIDGLGIFAISPSLLTFTFNSPIKSFGIFIAGLGTVKPRLDNVFDCKNSNRLLFGPVFKLF